MANEEKSATTIAGVAADGPFCPFMSFQMVAPRPNESGVAIAGKPAGQIELRPVVQPCFREHCALAVVTTHGGKFLRCGFSIELPMGSASALLYVGQQAQELKLLIAKIGESLGTMNNAAALSADTIAVTRDTLAAFNKLVMALLEKYTGDKHRPKNSKG